MLQLEGSLQVAACLPGGPLTCGANRLYMVGQPRNLNTGILTDPPTTPPSVNLDQRLEPESYCKPFSVFPPRTVILE